VTRFARRDLLATAPSLPPCTIRYSRRLPCATLAHLPHEITPCQAAPTSTRLTSTISPGFPSGTTPRGSRGGENGRKPRKSCERNISRTLTPPNPPTHPPPTPRFARLAVLLSGGGSSALLDLSATRGQTAGMRGENGQKCYDWTFCLRICNFSDVASFLPPSPAPRFARFFCRVENNGWRAVTVKAQDELREDR
jgi:hypothetical protein